MQPRIFVFSNGLALKNGPCRGFSTSQIPWRSNVDTLRIASKPALLKQLKTESVEATSPLKRLTTWHLMRNILLAAVLTRPILFKPALAAVKVVANSKNPLLNPDYNPLLRAFIKPVLYDHFCAGTTQSEIFDTITKVRNLGFSGVILCYGREITLNNDNSVIGTQSSRLAQLAAWRDGTLETLDMVDEGNWLGIKFTGAGENVTNALVAGNEAPAEFIEAIDAICAKARTKKCRIWIDAEQDAVQGGIDRWTIDLMRKYNKGGQVLVYNTIQAYLKSARQKLEYQLDLASTEGWTLAVKLVRGAYIAVDDRKIIHGTKAETDRAYNNIATDIMQGTVSKKKQGDAEMCLFLAGHNSESVMKTLQLGRKLSSKGALKVYPEYGQLQGMADDVGCSIIDFREQNNGEGNRDAQSSFQPQVFKCLTWGSISECIQYLVRRAVENSAAVDRMRSTAAASKTELYRRIFPKNWV